MDLKNIRSIIVADLQNYDPLVIYLFGSQVSGHMTSESDLDIAFLSQVEFEPMAVFLTAQKISSAINMEVDLVQMRNSNTVFQKEIVCEGTVLFTKSEKIKDEFELKVLKKYHRLNDERQEILIAYNAKYGGVRENLEI